MILTLSHRTIHTWRRLHRGTLDIPGKQGGRLPQHAVVWTDGASSEDCLSKITTNFVTSDSSSILQKGSNLHVQQCDGEQSQSHGSTGQLERPRPGIRTFIEVFTLTPREEIPWLHQGPTNIFWTDYLIINICLPLLPLRIRRGEEYIGHFQYSIYQIKFLCINYIKKF